MVVEDLWGLGRARSLWLRFWCGSGGSVLWGARAGGGEYLLLLLLCWRVWKGIQGELRCVVDEVDLLGPSMGYESEYREADAAGLVRVSGIIRWDNNNMPSFLTVAISSIYLVVSSRSSLHVVEYILAIGSHSQSQHFTYSTVY